MPEKLLSPSDGGSRLGAAASSQDADAPRLGERFLPDWAHQMRNPLFGLQAVLDGLEAECGSDDSRRSLIQLGQGQVLRLKRMADDLLAYGAPPPFNPTHTGLAPIVRDAIDQVRDAASGKGVALHADLPDADVSLTADHARLVLALSYLILNGVRRCPAGGRVAIGHRAADANGGAQHVIAVEDDGPAMDEALRASAFEPFAVRTGERTGLELAIVERVAVQHGGGVAIEARDAGGARFVLTLSAESG